MDLNRIIEVVAKRGIQNRRKDKDLMSDTGGTSKGRDREPDKNPSRDDLKKRYRKKRKPSGDTDPDVDRDPDKTADWKIQPAANGDGMCRRESSLSEEQKRDIIERVRSKIEDGKDGVEDILSKIENSSEDDFDSIMNNYGTTENEQ